MTKNQAVVVGICVVVVGNSVIIQQPSLEPALPVARLPSSPTSPRSSITRKRRLWGENEDKIYPYIHGQQWQGPSHCSLPAVTPCDPLFSHQTFPPHWQQCSQDHQCVWLSPETKSLVPCFPTG